MQSRSMALLQITDLEVRPNCTLNHHHFLPETRNSMWTSPFLIMKICSIFVEQNVGHVCQSHLVCCHRTHVIDKGSRWLKALKMAIMLLNLFHICNVLAFSNGISADETCALALHKSMARKSPYHYLAKGLPAHEDETCDSEVGLGRLEKYQEEGEEFLGAGFIYIFLNFHPEKLGKMFTQFDDHICSDGWEKTHLPGFVPLKM